MAQKAYIVVYRNYSTCEIFVKVLTQLDTLFDSELYQIIYIQMVSDQEMAKTEVSNFLFGFNANAIDDINVNINTIILECQDIANGLPTEHFKKVNI